jgi:nitrogen fixation protein FixH
MKRPHAWPVGITVVLLAFAAGNLMMMRVAADDPAFAIEPDYYRRAVGFDSTMEQERRSAALQWTAMSHLARGDGIGSVAVMLSDSAGRPIAGATVRVNARFNARANDILRAELVERSPGTYVGPLAIGHPGEWEVRVEAVRGAERFIASTRTQAPPAPE